MSGPAAKIHTWPNKGRQHYAKRKTSYLLLSLDCRPMLVPARLLHRHRRTRQVHLQVQQRSEVANGHQETGAAHQKLKTKIKRGIKIEFRTTVCETFWDGWRTSQKISKIQKCQHCGTHPQTLLRIQILNVLPKWYRGSTVFVLTSCKDNTSQDRFLSVKLFKEFAYRSEIE